MKFLIQSDLSKNDVESLFEWSDKVFPVEGKAFKWAESTHHIVARNEDRAIGHIGFGRFKVKGGLLEREVIGVGGVVVRPEFQGQGIPEYMFDILDSTETLSSSSTVKALFCPRRLLTYYQRHGYVLYRQGVSFLQGAGYIKTDAFCFMVKGEFDLSCKLQIPSYPW